MIDGKIAHRDFIKLSDRLMMSANMVTKGSRVADVGCDHAHTSIWLVKEGIAVNAIAMDVGEGPLSHARENIALYGLEDKITTRLSDGLEKLLPGEADSIVISGMGGTLTTLILSANEAVLQSVKELILQPQSDIWMVRRFLREHGFVIADEKMCIEDGKFYNSMKAVQASEMNASASAQSAVTASFDTNFTTRAADYKEFCEQLADEYGQLLLDRRDGVLKELLLILKGKNSRILDNIYKSAGEGAGEKRSFFENEKVLLEKALDYYQ